MNLLWIGKKIGQSRYVAYIAHRVIPEKIHALPPTQGKLEISPLNHFGPLGPLGHLTLILPPPPPPPCTCTVQFLVGLKFTDILLVNGGDMDLFLNDPLLSTILCSMLLPLIQA